MYAKMMITCIWRIRLDYPDDFPETINPHFFSTAHLFSVPFGRSTFLLSPDGDLMVAGCNNDGEQYRQGSPGKVQGQFRWTGDSNLSCWMRRAVCGILHRTFLTLCLPPSSAFPIFLQSLKSLLAACIAPFLTSRVAFGCGISQRFLGFWKQFPRATGPWPHS